MIDPVSRARELLAAATPGDWFAIGPDVYVAHGPRIAYVAWSAGTLPASEIAALIAAAPELLAQMADEIERLRAERDELNAVIDHLEKVIDDRAAIQGDAP